MIFGADLSRVDNSPVEIPRIIPTTFLRDCILREEIVLILTYHMIKDRDRNFNLCQCDLMLSANNSFVCHSQNKRCDYHGIIIDRPARQNQHCTIEQDHQPDF